MRYSNGKIDTRCTRFLNANCMSVCHVNGAFGICKTVPAGSIVLYWMLAITPQVLDTSDQPGNFKRFVALMRRDAVATRVGIMCVPSLTLQYVGWTPVQSLGKVANTIFMLHKYGRSLTLQFT